MQPHTNDPATTPGVTGNTPEQDPHAAPAPDATHPDTPTPDAPTPDAPTPDGTPQPTTPQAAAGVPDPSSPLAPEPAPTIDADMQAEIDAAMGALDAQDAGGNPGPATGAGKAKLRGPRVVQGGREHRTGTVVSVGATDIFIEFGPKELGVLEVVQFKDGEPLPNVGDAYEVVIQRYEASENIYICARPGAVQKADWELLEAGQTVEARVTGTNKGGLECEVAGHDAFMPASQVDVHRVPDLSVFVGEKFPCVVQRVDRRGRGSIVLSRRQVLEQEREQAAGKIRETLNEGDVVDGVVRKIMDFGAFVDLGGVDGLVHISDLAHERVNHGAKNVERHLSEGQKVRVQVLKTDWDSNRVSLGLKQLQADPFAAATNEVVEGATLSGKVTKLAEFGAFVEVAPGVEGLVHISELDWKRVAKVSDVVQPNEVVQVKVLNVDEQSRKISLSIKQTKEPPRREGGGGRGRGERDTRSAEDILKETPQLKRLREKAERERQQRGGKSSGGLGQSGAMGMGLGDLKL